MEFQRWSLACPGLWPPDVQLEYAADVHGYRNCEPGHVVLCVSHLLHLTGALTGAIKLFEESQLYFPPSSP